MSRCRSCLKETERDFCRSCARRLFGKERFSARLDFPLPDLAASSDERALRISISGAQAKFSLKLDGRRLVPTDSGGTYILKPATDARYRLYRDMPANEHLTMLMARRLFGLEVADCALMKFPSGDCVYMTKRYDVRADGTRLHQEDFAQVAGLSVERDGPDFKYERLSYEGIARLMSEHVAAYAVAAERFFRTLLFDYVVCNGDAHVKNFSVYCPGEEGVVELAPAYDLLNTALHVQEFLGRMALNLFDDEEDFETEFFRENGFYGVPDFMEFARRIGVSETRARRAVDDARAALPAMEEMIDASFLSPEAKSRYAELVRDRVSALRE